MSGKTIKHADFPMLVAYPVRMGTEVISIQDGGGMLTSSIRRAHKSRTSAKA